MKLITVHLPEPYITALAELVKSGAYLNRAEAIRSAIRYLLQTEYVWCKT